MEIVIGFVVLAVLFVVLPMFVRAWKLGWHRGNIKAIAAQEAYEAFRDARDMISCGNDPRPGLKGALDDSIVRYGMRMQRGQWDEAIAAYAENLAVQDIWGMVVQFDETGSLPSDEEMREAAVRLAQNVVRQAEGIRRDAEKAGTLLVDGKPPA